jgi:DsbC/DsbD-like thiol-disulfide interchange protein
MSDLHEKLRTLQEPEGLSHRITIYGDGSGTLEREVWPIPNVHEDDYEVIARFDNEVEMDGHLDLLIFRATQKDPLDEMIAVQERVLADLKERKKRRV